MLNKLVHISFETDENLSEESKVGLENLKRDIEKEVKSIVEVCKNGKIWDETICKLIITNSYKEDVENQAKEWNLPILLTSEKEYKGVSKTLYNNDENSPKRYIYFDFSIVPMRDYFYQIVIGQIIQIFAEKIIHGDLEKYNSTTFNPTSFNEYIYHSLVVWLPKCYSKRIEKEVFKDYKNDLGEEKLLNGFCRKLKRNLFEYNSDEQDNNYRINRFWRKSYTDFTSLICRFIEIRVTNDELVFEKESYLKLINPILDEIDLITNSQIKGKSFSISNLQKCIVAFFEEFQVNLAEAQVGIKIKLTKNPKDYFIDESIVDTEPRFVCFLDILGFTEMIEEYENDMTSTILQDIQEAFKSSMQVIENDNQPNKEMIKHLKYQLFSDCVSISIPYFDREDDFLSNFNLISAFIRGFQLTMMTKGFFVRGGLSIGSFYSDNHMIFSKGLVNAYHIESKKAIYPRVMVDKQILNKIDLYQEERVLFYGIHRYLISDWENAVFLNPFNITSGLVDEFEKLKDEIKFDESDEQGDVLNSLLDAAFNLLKEPLQKISDSEPELIQTIKNHIDYNKIKYAGMESTLSKYIWLDELLKWLEDSSSSELKFKYRYINTLN